jgi:hypothetical protein
MEALVEMDRKNDGEKDSEEKRRGTIRAIKVLSVLICEI